MPLPESEAFNIHFVKTVETFECLYDPTTPDYSSKQKQDKAWSQVAQMFSSTRSDCRLRWKYLRGSLTRYVKKRKTSQSIQQFYLWDCMQFVVPYLKSRRLTKTGTYAPCGSAVADDDYTMYPEDIDCGPDQEDDGVCEKPKVEPELPIYPPDQQNKEPERINQGSETMTNKCRKRMRSPTKDNSPVRECHSQSPQSHLRKCHCQYKSNSVGEPDNPDLNFFRSILSDVADLNASQKRRFKLKVLQLLDDISNEGAATQQQHPPASACHSSTTCSTTSSSGTGVPCVQYHP